MEERVKIVKIVESYTKSEEIIIFFVPYFCAFMDFYCKVVKRKHPCLLGCVKMRSPEMGTFLHWQPPDVHIFHTDPSPFS